MIQEYIKVPKEWLESLLELSTEAINEKDRLKNQNIVARLIGFSQSTKTLLKHKIFAVEESTSNKK